MTPTGVEIMKGSGHTILVEKNAGVGSGFDDKAYVTAGAEVIKTAKKIYRRSDTVMHVKEPQPSQYTTIRRDQIVFTYLHLAADKTSTRAMIKSRAIFIAYETIQKADGSLPLLIPMSAVAGRMAIQEGAKYPEMEYGGAGVLLSDVPGVVRTQCWSSARERSAPRRRRWRAGTAPRCTWSIPSCHKGEDGVRRLAIVRFYLQSSCIIVHRWCG